MDKKKCNSCGEVPHKCSCKNKEFTKAVIEIDNPEQITLMRRVVIPASMGDDTAVPPVVGKYHNVLLYYEANHKSYLYSSDGIPTLLANGLTDYEEAVNLPQVNGVTLIGDKTLNEIGINTYHFDTVADMKASTDLANGNYARTLGYYSKDDMGGAYYKISSTAPSGHYETLTSGLYAELVLQDTMNVKQFGAKGDGATDDTIAIQSALDNCSNKDATLIFPNSVYTSRELTSNEITINGGGATIKAYDNSTSVLLTTNDYSEINDLNFDGNNLSSTLLHSNSFKIRIVNCLFENSLGDAINNTPVQDDNSEAYFDNVEFHNCVGGIRYLGYAYNDPDDYKGSVKFINCRSTGNTGSSDSNRIYFFQKLNYVSVRGGDFTGDSTHGATNIYQVNHGEIIGGYYHDILRGATLGLITKNCTVTNTVNENITGGGGLHIDLVTADRVHPEGHSIIANNIVKNAYRGMFIQGKNLLINNNYIYCGPNTQTTGGVIRFNDNDDNTSNSNVVVDNLYVYNLGSNSNVITCGTAVITLGSVYLDGANIVQASVASDNPIIKNNTRIGNTSGSTHVTINDEVIIINATGTCNIMLPNLNETKTLGKKYTIVRTDDTASTVSLRCRSDNGTINGQTSGAGNVPIAKGVTNVVQTGAGEYWTLS